MLVYHAYSKIVLILDFRAEYSPWLSPRLDNVDARDKFHLSAYLFGSNNEPLLVNQMRI